MSKKNSKSEADEEVLREQAPEEADEIREKPPEEETAEQKVREVNDKYLRLYAEFDNYKRRTQKEKDARYADAVIDTAAKILQIGDNLERALQIEVNSEDAVKLKKGVEMVKKQFDEVLAVLDIGEIKAVGEQFDPNYHSAVMHIEDETIDDNTVVEELMKGYKYKDGRIVRHSMVKVAN